jgi:type I restriction-modification system DNA methylase subunit
MPANHTEIERRLWDAADELRANSKLKSSEYSVPVLGLIFLRYADHKFTLAEGELQGKTTGRRPSGDRRDAGSPAASLHTGALQAEMRGNVPARVRLVLWR